jgi:D-amino-acid dehydrogenase
MIVPSHFVPLAAPGMVSLGLRMMWNPESPFYLKPRLDPALMRWMWLFMKSSTRKHVDRAAPLLRDLHMLSRKAFVEFSKEHAGSLGLVENGLMMLCKEAHTWQEERIAADKARDLGVPADVLTPEEASKLEPGVRMNIAGAVYYPKDCHLSPQRFMAALTDWLQAQGATFRWNCEVTGWKLSAHGLDAVTTSQGEFTADEFVIAGGAWSPAIAKSLGLDLPMQAGKGYSLTLPAPRRLPSICSILTEARVAVTPMGKTLRFGGTMEIAGLNTEVNPGRVRGIVNSVPRYLPDFQVDDFSGVQPWCGLRPCSPDGLPYVGRSRRHKNLLIATGHAMMGLSLGPVTGMQVSDLISNLTPCLPMELLDPNRFE